MSRLHVTRRGILGAGMAIAAGAVGAPLAYSPAYAKNSKQQVAYQAQPKDGKKCADCKHFVASDNTCKLVDGDISPNAFCRLWSKK